MRYIALGFMIFNALLVLGFMLAVDSVITQLIAQHVISLPWYLRSAIPGGLVIIGMASIARFGELARPLARR